MMDWAVVIGLVLLIYAAFITYRWKKAAEPPRLFAQFGWEGVTPRSELMLKLTNGSSAPIAVDGVELVVERTATKERRRQWFQGAGMQIPPYASGHIGVHRVVQSLCRAMAPSAHAEGDVRMRAVVRHISQGARGETTSIPFVLTLGSGKATELEPSLSEEQVVYLSFDDITVFH
jgi:hypothetical protein